jgi:cutinase-like protein
MSALARERKPFRSFAGCCGGDNLAGAAERTDRHCLRVRRVLPDVEVTFARATNEPPGVGGVGQAFVDSLRSQVGGRSVGVYPVNYPATEDWAPSASAGASDASAHVQSMAANCPNTRLVLGGYSQGAMVRDLITIAQAPVAGFIPASLPADVADHVAAVAVFGNPTDRLSGGQ